MFDTIVIGPIAGERLVIVRHALRECVAQHLRHGGCAVKIIVCALLAAALWAPPPAIARDAKCAPQAAMIGMHERIASLREQMDVIERTTDRGEQRRLLELHSKLMSEGMHEIRYRDLAPPCRIEMMASIMDVMIRHQQAMQDVQAPR